MNREQAVKFAMEAAKKSHGHVCNSLDSMWTVSEKVHWVSHAMLALAIGTFEFIKTNTHHDHADFYLPLTQAAQQMHLSFAEEGLKIRHLWDAKRTLENLIHHCEINAVICDCAKGGVK